MDAARAAALDAFRDAPAFGGKRWSYPPTTGDFSAVFDLFEERKAEGTDGAEWYEFDLGFTIVAPGNPELNGFETGQTYNSRPVVRGKHRGEHISLSLLKGEVHVLTGDPNIQELRDAIDALVDYSAEGGTPCIIRHSTKNSTIERDGDKQDIVNHNIRIVSVSTPDEAVPAKGPQNRPGADTRNNDQDQQEEGDDAF